MLQITTDEQGSKQDLEEISNVKFSNFESRVDKKCQLERW